MGNDELPGEHAAPWGWQKVNWEKVGEVFDSKWVKGAGFAGTAIATANSYSDHKGKATQRPRRPRGRCGPAARACSTVLGGAGAAFGGWVGGEFTDFADSEIGWTAGKIDDGIDIVQGVDYTFWN